MSYFSFLVVYLGFSMYGIMSSHIITALLLFQFSSLFFLSDSVARTSNVMLNKSGERGHLYFVSDLRGNAFNFLPLDMMLAVSLSYIALMLRYDSLYTHFVRVF